MVVISLVKNYTQQVKTNALLFFIFSKTLFIWDASILYSYAIYVNR